MILNKEIPLKYKIKAIIQWLFVSAVLLSACISGVVMAALACITAKRTVNAFGEFAQKHDQKYINQGASGHWEYWASTIPFVKLWSNYEDGDLGEPSGKHSARCNGQERKFWNRYKWNALRNPFNMGKRTISFFHCVVDECDIEYFGDKVVGDKYGNGGWNFTIATHRETGKKYYGFYSVRYLDSDKVRVKRFGFKIKPSHADEAQDVDDRDKAFTFRYQHASEID